MDLQETILKTEKAKLAQREVFGTSSINSARGDSIVDEGLSGEINKNIAALDRYTKKIEELQIKVKEAQEDGESGDKYLRQIDEISNKIAQVELDLLDARKVVADYVSSLGEDAPARS